MKVSIIYWNHFLQQSHKYAVKISKIEFWFIKEKLIKKHKICKRCHFETASIFWIMQINIFIFLYVFISYHPGVSMKMKFDQLDRYKSHHTLFQPNPPPKFWYWQNCQGLLSTFELLWTYSWVSIYAILNQVGFKVYYFALLPIQWGFMDRLGFT